MSLRPVAREWLVRLVALVSLGCGLLYLVWRPLATMRGAPGWLTFPLYGAEVVAWLSLAGFAFVTWTVRPSSRRPVGSRPSVDVVVPTYDENDDVLRPTLIGCLGLDYPNASVHVLDDGRRPWVARLARELGITYHSRSDNADAKAGNINAALPALTGDLLLILDSDHVPQPDLLQATVGYFDDRGVAFVQTPHEFYNADSVQHVSRDEHDQSLFYRVIQPGRDWHGGAFWCGSGAVIRRQALVEVGGLATETITEDFHTSLKLHRAGWRSRYHNEPLVFGIAPQNIAQFLLQRDRWASGNLAALRTRESPLTAPKLGIRRRLCYLIGLFEVVAAPQRIIVVSVLAATVSSGELPLRAPIGQFLPIFAAWVITSVVASSLLSRGRLNLLNASRFEYFTLPSHLRGLASLVWPEEQFKVTPKDGIDHGGLSWVRHNLALAGLIAALTGAVAWRAGAILGLLPAHHLRPGVLAVILTLVAFELARLLQAAISLSRHRQLRTAYRFTTALPGEAQGRPCTVEDLSAGGCAFAIDGLIELSDEIDLTIDFGALGRHRFTVAQPRYGDTAGEQLTIHGRIHPTDKAANNALAAALFILAPTRATLTETDLHDDRATRLAERLQTAGALTPPAAELASAL